MHIQGTSVWALCQRPVSQRTIMRSLFTKSGIMYCVLFLFLFFLCVLILHLLPAQNPVFLKLWWNCLWVYLCLLIRSLSLSLSLSVSHTHTHSHTRFKEGLAQSKLNVLAQTHTAQRHLQKLQTKTLYERSHDMFSTHPHNAESFCFWLVLQLSQSFDLYGGCLGLHVL